VDLWHLLVGRPLKAREAAQEAITTPEGMAALSLDALSSVAYGPGAVLFVLATFSPRTLPYALPIVLSIVVLLIILVLSYSQVIEAFPNGGGAYAVSRANLGPTLSHVAAASLIVDYVLTVAVSIAAGVDALTSAFPSLIPLTLPMDLGLVALIMMLNLRGVGESARVFLLPAFVFIFGVLGVVAFGIIHPVGVRPVPIPAPVAPLGAFGFLLLLRAFSNGCSALTGVEAIANGVPLFKAPEVRRAKNTEYLLGLILSLMLIGIGILALRLHTNPLARETVLSQVIAGSVGRSPVYYVVELSVTAVLGLAANTSFGGLPLLAGVLAQDNLLPHVFAIRGDRHVYQYGIVTLALLASVLLLASGGDTNALIPLYAIGVFTGFTLSQSGLVRHWLRERPANWRPRVGLNALGAVITGLATITFVFSKFTDGAWVVVIAIPLVILLFRRIHRYYGRVGAALHLGQVPPPLRARKVLVVVPVTGLSELTARALEDAVALSGNVVAVSVVFDDEAERRVEEQWQAWNPGVRLITLKSQYRSVIRPILRFVNSVEARSHDRVVVLIPEIVPQGLFHNFLHNQMGVLMTAALRSRSDAVVAMVPLHVDEAPASRDDAEEDEPVQVPDET
jgi:amino acid transporter